NISINGTTIESAEHIRWLGVYLDTRLTFKHHVETWCGKALKAAHLLRQFNSTHRGAAPAALVRAVDSCIVSVATYGADIWWPGINRPTYKGTSTPPTSTLCSMIDKAILRGLRAALPVLKTTPTVVVQREGGIPPGKILLEGNRLRLAARLQTLDNRHPLRARAALCPNTGTRKYKKKATQSKKPEVLMTRVQRAYQQLPEAEAAGTLPPPPYLPDLGTKEAKLGTYKRWITSVPISDICAYSDGSSEGHGRSSWGFVLQREGKTFASGNGIKHGGEVFDAEITGARKALDAALKVAATTQQTKIHVLIDSQQAVNALLTGNTTSSLKEVLDIRALAEKENIRVHWVPGHAGIQGNEEADALARAALRNLPSTENVPENITLGYL
ncbi:hypothetical protein K3495_g15856, partial [Podosphaera aphanis]